MNELVSVFQALSDETRLRTLKLLEDGELCVCDIVAALDMFQPKVSFHLKILKDAGLIKDRRQGKWIHYSIHDSDLFKRFLIHTVLEKISSESVREDQNRLSEFRQNKKGLSCA
ncbi:MAG: ArsR/SmtB family transcription factor [Dissulfurispiraceae bacterium]